MRTPRQFRHVQNLEELHEILVDHDKTQGLSVKSAFSLSDKR